MKKRLTVILSLIMAFVLCFALVACGGDKGTNKPGPGPGPGPGPDEPDNTVSISLNDAIDAIDGVLNAQGIVGTATYTLSTKNTEAVTDSVAFDKRGNKIKIIIGSEDMIIDLATGYVYFKETTGYKFAHEFYANEVSYVQHVLNGLKQADATDKIKATYDEEAKTITLVEDLAEGFNKYLAPLQDAYKDKASLGELLDEYCDIFFGKSFDEAYTVIEDFVKDTNNTIGTLLGELEKLGVDVEAILEMTGLEMSEEELNAIKARPLDQVVAGAANFIMASLGDMMPAADGGDDEPVQGGDGMESLVMGLLQAMLFDDVSEEEVAAGLQGMKGLVGLVSAFKVDALIDMALKDIPQVADLYTVIKDNVRLKNATVTITLTQDDDKNITGIKVDCLASHTYDGEATEGSFLADNDYRATAEIKIDEYTTSTEDFVINIDPACNYKTSVISLLYDVTDKDVSVYFEAGGNTVNMTSYSLYTQPLNGEVTPITDAAENAFRFDAATSSFVFDGALVKSALTDVEFGDSLYAVVFFDNDDYNGYVIALSYVNDDINDISDYLYNSAMESILDFISGGSHDTPTIKSDIADGTYYFFTDDGELDDTTYWVIEDGSFVTCINSGDDVTDNVMLAIYGDYVDVVIAYGDYSIVLYGKVYENYIHVITQTILDENGDYDSSGYVNNIMYRGDAAELTEHDGRYVFNNGEDREDCYIVIVNGEIVAILDGGYKRADEYVTMISENEFMFGYQISGCSFMYTGTIEDGVITLTEYEAYDDNGDLMDDSLPEALVYIRGAQTETAMYA